MSLDKNELKYLVNELKKVFATKKEFNNIKDVVDEPPVYVEPTTSLSLNPVIMLRNELTEISIAPKFVQNDAGEVNRVVVKRNDEILYDVGALDVFTDFVRADHNESVVYTVEIYFNDGIVKESLLGVPDEDNNIKGGMCKVTQSITAYAPSFYGIMDNDYNFINTVKILIIISFLSQQVLNCNYIIYNQIMQHLAKILFIFNIYINKLYLLY